MGIGKIDNVALKQFAASNNNRFINFFKKRLTTKKEINHLEDEVRSNFDQIVFGNEEEKLDFSIAKCCNPIPGDDVFGFITINEGIKIHKQDCLNSISLQSKFAYRIIKSKWIDSSQEEFSSAITISGIDNLGIVNEITKLISNSLNINMQKMSFDTKGNTFSGKITLKVKTKNILNKLIQRLRKINGIEKVIRE